MRIRQVRPEFWTDDKLSQLPDPVRLFYIGLWCVADDAGWLRFAPATLGALLYPYKRPESREKLIIGWAQQLVDSGRLHIEPDNCAVIPTLAKHQRVAGNQSFTVRDAHRAHLQALASQSSGRSLQVATRSPVESSRVEQREEGEEKGSDEGLQAALLAAGVKPELVRGGKG